MIAYQRVKLSDLHQDPANARLHPDENLADIRASLKEFGQVEPLVVQKSSSKIVGGNGRYKVMQELGWTECDVAFVEMDNMKATALGIALNRAGERAEWDTDVLNKLLAEIGDDVSEELAASLKELEGEIGVDEPAGDADAEPQIDKAAELQKKWGTETGQLWLIGEHRLLCGDSTKREDVERVMGGGKASITFTSPPYNLGTNVSLSTRGKKDNAYGDYQDAKKDDEWLSLMSSFFIHANTVSKFQFINVQMLSGNKVALLEFMAAFKDKFADVAVWTKSNPQPAMAEGVMNSAFEFILIYSQEDNPTRRIPGDFRGTVSNVYSGTVNSENVIPCEHSATFPLSLCTDFLKVHAIESVYEPFSGSGTTFVAAQNLNRKCYGIEISPAYIAVILERMATAFPELEIRQA